METYFKENTDVQAWVDLLIEKIFTVCLLNGSDADSEFSRGRQAANRIAGILQGLSDFPEDTLKEGIRQLVEQRLPDPRVIDNFPQFYRLMEDMIKSGLPNVQTSEVESDIPDSALSEETPSSKIKLTRRPEKTENYSQVIIPEVAVFDNENCVAINVFAGFSPLTPPNEPIPSILPEPKIASSEAGLTLIETEIPPKIERVKSYPVEGEQLLMILKNFILKCNPFGI